MQMVVDYIDSRKDEMLTFLEKLVNIDSGSNFVEGVNQVGSMLIERLNEWGFETSIMEGHRYGNHIYAQYGTGDPSVLLMGHIDTVFPAGTAKQRPFTLNNIEDKAYGPGVFDMKSGDVVMLYAVRAFLNSRSGEINGSVRIYLNSDEEPGSPESRDQLPKCLEGVNAALVFEPPAPDGTLVTRRKGVGIFRLSVKGKAAHAGSEPEEGANAIDELIKKLVKINQLADPEKGTTINVGVIKGGEEPYIVPEQAEASVDIRVPTLDEQRRIELGIQTLAKETAIGGTQTSVNGGFHRPPMEPCAGTAELEGVIQSAGALLGSKVSFTTSPRGGASDGNLIATAGTPCVDGMGALGGGAHTAQEFIVVSSMFEKAKLAALVLDALF